MRGIEFIAQRFRTEITQQRMLQRITFKPQRGTEATRIVQTELLAAVERDGEMIVLLERRVRRQHTQIARHAEMQQQRAFGGAKEHVLRPTRARVDAAACEFMNRVRHRPAHAFVPHNDLTHAFPDHMR